MKYIISDKAIEDLEHIWLYTYNNWSKKQADNYYDLIINEIEKIATNSSIYKSVDYISKGYQVAKVKSHIIFFKKQNQIVRIVRILHERMDLPSRIND